MEQLLHRDRLIASLGLAGIALLSWWYLIDGAGTGMNALAMTTWEFPPPPHPASGATWPASYWLIMFFMWWIMMIAMMLPSASPMLLLYLRVLRHNSPPGTGTALPGIAFLGGYLLAWLLFSLAATGLQWALERAALLHSMLMWSSNLTLSACLLILAGLYQFTALKRVCLVQCRAPASWLSRHWRAGSAGALSMGARHGLYCVGCCWSLMLLLFVGGVMNLVWIAGLAIVVLAEKLLPGGESTSRVLGAGLCALGAYLLLA